jgi:hypothetical protein
LPYVIELPADQEGFVWFKHAYYSHKDPAAPCIWTADLLKRGTGRLYRCFLHHLPALARAVQEVRPTLRRPAYNWLRGNAPSGFRAGLRLALKPRPVYPPLNYWGTNEPWATQERCLADLIPLIRFNDQAEAAMFRLMWL